MLDTAVGQLFHQFCSRGHHRKHALNDADYEAQRPKADLQ